jgi:hypothetical protein
MPPQQRVEELPQGMRRVQSESDMSEAGEGENYYRVRKSSLIGYVLVRWLVLGLARAGLLPFYRVERHSHMLLL